MALNIPKLRRLSENLMSLARGLFDEPNWQKATALFRFLILILLAVRFSQRAPQFDYSEARLTLWFVVLSLYLAYLIFLFLVWRRKESLLTPKASETHLMRVQVWGDLVFLGTFYLMGGDPESQLSLLMLFPLVLGARYLKSEALYLYLGSLVFLTLMTFLFQTGWNRSFPLIHLKYNPFQYLGVQAVIFGAVILPFAYSETLRDDLARRNQRAQTDLMKLLETGAKLGHESNLQELFNRAVHDARNLLNSEVADLFLFSHGRYVRVQHVPQREGWFPEESYAPGEGITGQVVALNPVTTFGKPIMVNNAAQHPQIRKDHLDLYRDFLPSKEVFHLLAVPLNGPNRTFGILRVINKKTSRDEIDSRGFTVEDQASLGSVAAMVALAIAHQRSHEKEGITRELMDTLSTATNQQQLCQQVVNSIVKFGYEGATVWQYDTDGAPLQLVASRGIVGLGVAPASPNEEITRCFVQRVESGQTNGSAFLAQEMTFKLNPIFVNERVWGAIHVFAPVWYRFYKTEVHTLTTLTAHLGRLLENTINRQKRDNYIQQLTKLADMSDVLSRVLDIRDLQRVITEFVADLLRAERCVLYWANAHQQYELVCEYPSRTERRQAAIPLPSKSAPYEQGFVGYVADTQTALYLDAAGYASHPARRYSEDSPSATIFALLVCPLVDARGDVKGVISIENKARDLGPCDKNDADLVRILSGQIDAVFPRFLRDEIFQSTVKESNPVAALSSIAYRAATTLRADAAIILPFDSRNGMLQIERAVSHPAGPLMYRRSHPSVTGLTEIVINSSEGFVIVPDCYATPFGTEAWLRSPRFRACIAVRLEISKNCIGIMYFGYLRKRSKEDLQNDVPEAMAFASSTAKAINIAILLAEKNHALIRQLSIRELNLDIQAYANFEKLATAITEHFNRVFQTESCRFWFVDGAKGTVEVKGHSPESVSGFPTYFINDANPYSEILGRGEIEVKAETNFDTLRYPVKDYLGRVVGIIEAESQINKPTFLLDEEVSTFLHEIADLIQKYRALESQRSINVLFERLNEIGRSYRITKPSSLQGFIEQIVSVLAEWLSPNGGACIQVEGNNGKQVNGYTAEWVNSFVKKFQNNSKDNDVPKKLYDYISDYSYIPFDLCTDDESLGTLHIVSRSGYLFLESEKTLFKQCAEIIALWIAVALQKTTVLERLEHLEQHVMRTYHGHLKSNLSYIRSSLENLLDDKEEPLGRLQRPDVESLYGRVLELMNHVHVALMTEQIEDGSQSGGMSECTIDELLDKAKSHIEPLAAARQVDIAYHRESRKSPMVRVNKVQLVDALCEVIYNAIKYSPRSGKIKIWVEYDGSHVRIYVQDSGIGIPIEERKNVFKKGYRGPGTSHFAEGTGNGLYMVERILHHSNGSIRIVPNIDDHTGTTMEICLPHDRLSSEIDIDSIIVTPAQ